MRQLLIHTPSDPIDFMIKKLEEPDRCILTRKAILHSRPTRFQHKKHRTDPGPTRAEAGRLQHNLSGVTDPISPRQEDQRGPARRIHAQRVQVR
jgi:hypothetical protein